MTSPAAAPPSTLAAHGHPLAAAVAGCLYRTVILAGGISLLAGAVIG